MAKGSLPHQRACSQRWGAILGPRRPVALRAEPRPILAIEHKTAGNAHPGLQVGGNRPADRHCPGSTRDRHTGALLSSEELRRGYCPR